MPRGGPNGGGRPPGSKNKLTKQRQEIAQKAVAKGITPLQYMLDAMRDPSEPKSRRDFMAVSVAPYVHPRLSSVDVNDTTPRRNSEDIDARILEVLRAIIEEGRAIRAAGSAIDVKAIGVKQTIALDEGEQE